MSENDESKKNKFLITPKQQEALNYIQDGTTEEIMLCGGANSAKSSIVQYAILKLCLKYAGFKAILVRKNITSSLQTAVETLYEVMEKQGIPSNVFVFDRQTSTFVYENGSQILLVNGEVTPTDRSNQLSRLGSIVASLCVIEECNEISEFFYDTMFTRIRWLPPSMDGVDFVPKIIAVTNPDVNSFLYTRYWKPFEDGTLADNIKVVHSTIEDNPFVLPLILERARKLKEPQYSRLYLGKWVAQSDDVLIEQSKLDNLFKPLDPNQFKPDRISCDPARFGQDSTIICLAHDLVVVQIIKLKNKSTKEVADEIKKLMKQYDIPASKVCIDQDGIGSGVVDNIRGCIGVHNGGSPVNKENFQNIKSQMFYKFSELADQISIICDSETQTAIKKEFGAIDKIIRNDDKWKITSKEEIKAKIGKSPDYADALAYLMWFKLKKNTGLWHLYT